jgi:sugar lactone lactonase YvrE
MESPNGVLLSPDQSLLFVADYGARWVWSFQIQPDGTAANGQPFYHLEIGDASSRSLADGMAVTADGHLLVATDLGLQICDQPGRVVGILAKPQPGPLTNAVFAGPDLQTLYVTSGDKVFRRHMRISGVRPWEPVTPPVPGL